MGIKSLQRLTRRANALSAKVIFLGTIIAVLGGLSLGKAWSAEQPPLVFLGDKDYPPVAFFEEGQAKGMDVDLAKALAQPMKREIRVDLMDWNLAQQKVLNGEADGLLGLSVSEERRKLYDFATPTFTREFGFVVRLGDGVIRGGRDLMGKKVGVTAGGFPRKFMEAQAGVNLVLIDNYDDGFERLKNGTIDAIAADLWVAAYMIEKNGIHGVSIVGKSFATAPGAIAVKKGNQVLLNQINRAIEMREADGTITKIQENWQPHEMVFASREKIRDAVTVAVGVILAVLFGIMALWIFSLRKHIRIRKKAELALRESEERFQFAVRGSTDGLWDRNFLTGEVFFSDRYRALLGYAADEFPGSFDSFASSLHPEDKERVLKTLNAHLEQHEPYDTEYRLRTKNGDYHWFRERAQAIWDDQGRAIRMAGSITDIARRKQAEERINLLQMITMDVTVAKDLYSALEVVLRRVCEKTGWALGQAWVPNQNETALDFCPIWFAPHADLEDFRLFSRVATFEPGVGLPGRVWASKQPAWVRDVTQDANFPRSEVARKCGLKSGLAVPILSGKKVLAVLEFFLKEPRAEDERLVQVITAVAAQIGLVIDRKRAEEALRKSEEMVRAVVEDQSEMILRWKPDGRRTFVNQAYCRNYGYRREEIIGKSFFPLLNEEDRKSLLLKICSLTPIQPVSTDLRKNISSSGEVYWHEWTDRGLFDADGRLVEIQSTGRDITKRKRAEELNKTQRHALEMIAGGKPMTETLDALLRMIESQSPSMFSSILLLEPDGVHVRHCAAPSLPAEYLKAIDGLEIGLNAGSCGAAAFRREPVFVADIETDPLWANYKQFALSHGLRACWSTPILDAQGKVLGTFAIYYRQTGLPDESHQKLIDMVTDTATVCIAKHRADEALRESEEQFRTVVEYSPECIAVSVDDRLVYVNSAGVKMFGANDSTQLLGRSVYDFGPPELHGLARERRRAVLQSGKASPPLVSPLIRLDGQSFFAETISAPFNYRGQPAILNLIRDITERKRAEEALRKSEELFRAVVEDQSEMIVRWKSDGTRTFVNGAYSRIFGGTPEQLLGTSFFPLISETDREAALERFRAISPTQPVSTAVHRSVSPTGGILWQEWTDRGIFDEQGKLVELQSVGRDITERKQAEEERAQAIAREQKALKDFAQRLIESQESERRRIAGELHDSLGQNLSIIKNRTHLALTEKSTPSETRTQLEAINDLVSQAIVEVRQISRDLHPYQINHLGLTRAIEAMINATAEASEIKFQSKLDVVDECFPPDAAVNLYRVVQESLNNILKHSGAKQARIELERDVHEIQLRIEDDGCGFDVKSEKAGLGLRNMAERVRILHGELKIDSEPNQGARIRVNIPIAEEKCL